MESGPPYHDCDDNYEDESKYDDDDDDVEYKRALIWSTTFVLHDNNSRN